MKNIQSFVKIYIFVYTKMGERASKQASKRASEQASKLQRFWNPIHGPSEKYNLKISQIINFAIYLTK